MVEVIQILLLVDPCTHRRDIESEQGTADGTKGGQNVDI